MIDLKPGDKVKTRFYPKDSHLLRTVTEVKPYIGGSESGWEVTTIDNKNRVLSCDRNWYEKVNQNT